MLPTIVKLFATNDRAIRVGLLQHIDQFGESLSSQIVDEQVHLMELIIRLEFLHLKNNSVSSDLHNLKLNVPCNSTFQVYPHVATGFSDTSALLRELTLKSMLVLAPKVHLITCLSNISF